MKLKFFPVKLCNDVYDDQLYPSRQYNVILRMNCYKTMYDWRTMMKLYGIFIDNCGLCVVCVFLCGVRYGLW